MMALPDFGDVAAGQGASAMCAGISVRSASAGPAEEDERAASIDEAGIRRLVYGFYDAVRGDPLLGSVFNREIAPDEWPPHLETMCAFWSSVLLRTRGYDGRPMRPHLGLADISDAHFQRWLDLFAVAAHNAFDEAGATITIAYAERIAQSFRLGIAMHRGEDTIRIRPLAARSPAD